MSHLVAFDSEICGASLDQLSFPSQPPDIRDWFSSYQYESPESPALLGDLDCSLLPEKDESETQDPFVHPNFGKNEDPPSPKDKYWTQSLSVMPSSSDLALSIPNRSLVLEFEGNSAKEHDDEHKDHNLPRAKIKCEEQCLDPNDPCSDPTDGFIPTRREDDRKATGVNFQSVSISRAYHGDINANKENYCDNSKSSQGIGVFKVKRKRSLKQVLGEEVFVNHEEGRVYTPKKHEEHLGGKDWRRDAYTKPRVENEVSLDKQSILVCSKAPSSVNTVTNISISTKNIEISRNENMMSLVELNPTIECNNVEDMNGVLVNEQLMSGGSTLQESNRSLTSTEQSRREKRNPLSDKTNLQAGLAPEAPEDLGKWRCPRANKPYKGPPLKQLRLEQWLRRAN